MVSLTDLENEDEISGFDVPASFLNHEPNLQGFSSDSVEEQDYRTKREKSSDAFKYAIPNSLIGGLSEIAESMPGIDENDANALVETLTTEGMKRNFDANEDAYKLTGALVSSFVPILGMQKLMRLKSVYNRIEKVAGKKVAKGLLPSQISVESRAETIRQQAQILAKKQSNTINREINSELFSKIQKTSRSEAIDMFKIGVATDIGIYIMLSESEFFFPEEMSTVETAAMYAVPNAIFSGVAGAVMRHKLKNVVRDVGVVGAEARNVSGQPLSDVMARPGERSNLITAYMGQVAVKESELLKASGDPVLTSNIESQIVTVKASAFTQVQKLAEDSLYSTVTKKHTLDIAEMNTLDASLKTDFTTLMDTVSIEKFDASSLKELPKKLQKRKETLQTVIDEKVAEFLKIPETQTAQRSLKTQELVGLYREAKNIDKSSVLKLDVDGSLSLASQVKPSFDDVKIKGTKAVSDNNAIDKIGKANFGQIVRVEKSLDKNDSSIKKVSYAARLNKDDSTTRGLVSDNLDIGIADYKNVFKRVNKQNYGDLTFQGKTGIQALTREAVKNWNPEIAETINLSGLSHHTQLDAVLELGEKFGFDNQMLTSKIKFGSSSFANWKEIEFGSLNRKYQEFGVGLEKIGRQMERDITLGKGTQDTLESLITELNLPNNGISGIHPVIELFSDLQKSGVKSLDEIYPNVDVLKSQLAKLVKPVDDGFDEFIVKPEMSLRGSRLKVFDEERKPLLLVIEDSGIDPMKRSDFTQAVFQQRSTLITAMKNAANKGAPLIAKMTEEMIRDPARLKAAKDVNSLFEGSQIRQDRIFQTMGGLENQTAILAVDSITNSTDNVVKKYIRDQFKPHNRAFEKLIDSNDTGDLISYNIATHQVQAGWRGSTNLVAVENEAGKLIGYKIPFEDHPKNKQMLKEQYNISDDALDQFEFMPAPIVGKNTAYQPMVLTPLAAESVMAINKMSQDVLTHINVLRELSGLKPIQRKELHLIPKNLADKEKVFLMDSSSGEVYSIASGDTAIQARKVAEQEIKLAGEQGKKLFTASEKDLQNYNMVKLDDFTRMVDFSTTFKQTGPGKGTSVGAVIENGPEVLKKQQESLINQYMTVGRVNTAMFFEPEMRFNEMAAMNSGASSSSIVKGRDVWNTWTRRALGKKSGDEHQTIGKTYGSIEDVYDKIWSKVKDAKVAQLGAQKNTVQGEKEWQGLNGALPDYNPFKDSQEYIQNTMRIKPPQTMIKHATKLNSLTGAMLLRIGELGLAAINIMSLPTIIPIVANALRLKPGQDIKLWKQENAAWSSTIDESTALWNPTRASISGAHFFFTKEGQSIIKEAGVKGHLWQKTVEQMNLFASPTKGYAERMLEKAVDFTSIAVDKTEEWSRGISYATFYKLGKDKLKLDKESSMEFAHQMANRVIGDFRPNNRPQIFQGAVGMPFGLFTTFAWNYLQRVYGYMEKGDFNSFWKQMGLQAAFFGTKSLPGFNQYVDNFTENYDGTENLVDRLQNTYNTEITDALLFGSVGTLTNTAMYTRTDIAIPGSNYMRNYSIADMAPAAGLIKQTYRGISESVKSISANEGFNGQQLSEIAARTFPVKSVKGWIEIANGQSVDSRGQIINENINTASEIGAKMFAMKPIRDQGIIEEFSRIRSTQLKRKDARSEFRKALRASFRSGKLDKSRLDSLIKQYGKSTGGDYSNLKTTFRNEMEAALVNKAYLKVLQQAGNASQEDSMMRMIGIINRED